MKITIEEIVLHFQRLASGQQRLRQQNNMHWDHDVWKG